MQEWNGLFLPDGERHLIEWMEATGVHKRAGVPTYQYAKYERVLALVDPARRRVAVDVGAHIGQWSRVMAHDFDRVFAFEPVTRYRECWRANMAGMGNAVLHAVALGAAPGTVSLHNGTPGSHGDTWIARPNDTWNAELSVAMQRLDDFNLFDVDLLKVDCEGYELFVLQGARETLIRCRPAVIVEQKPGHAEKFGLGRTDAVAFLEDLGAKRRGEISGDFLLSW